MVQSNLKIMTIRERIEQEARDRYPMPVRVQKALDDNDANKIVCYKTIILNATLQRAAYVECKMSMVDEIEKAWDAGLTFVADNIPTSISLDRSPEIAKAEYINNLFKK